MRQPEQSQNKERSAPKYRGAVLEGLFYPANPDQLDKKLDKLLADVPYENQYEDQCARAIVSPHGSLDYSGEIAAAAWQGVRRGNFDTIVLLGSSHRAYEAGVFLSESDFFSVPGRNMPVNRELVRDLVMTSTGFIENDIAHLEEQGLEMQLIFAAKLFPDCQIVPILVSGVSHTVIDRLYASLFYSLQNRLSSALIVISSNMAVNRESAVCEEETKAFVEFVLAGDSKAVEATENVDSSFCGSSLIAGYMRSKFANGLKARCLGISTSAEFAEAEVEDATVGYAAICFGERL
jgi:AmmeMemoRadiSam system protein B